MMRKSKEILILRGGKNEEHEISLKTANEVGKALKKLGRDPANILQRNRKVQPLVPKRATTKQMTELKGKIDK